MLIRIDGRHDGVRQYLEKGQKRGRELTRDALDERVPLAGDLDLTDAIIQSIHAEPGVDRYLSITLSFREDHIDRETLDAIVRDFEAFVFSAFRPDEYNFYAEAHLPRVKSYLDSRTGQRVERKPHIHIVIPKMNLISGQHMEPLGYVKSNIAFIDAFQEVTNARYGLSSPKDNRRVVLTDASEMISRYRGDIFRDASRAFKEQLLETMLERRIERHEDFMAMLAGFGETRLRNAGRENEYPNVKPPGAAKGVNLKEHVFSRGFIELPTQVKRLQLSAEMTPMYESLGAPHEPASGFASTLANWHQFRAREVKYLRNGNTHAVPDYQEATPEIRLRQLDERARRFYDHHLKDHDEPRSAQQRPDVDEGGQRPRCIDRMYGFKRAGRSPGIGRRSRHGAVSCTGRPPLNERGRYEFGRQHAAIAARLADGWQSGAVAGWSGAATPAVDGVRGVSGVRVVGVPARPAVLLPDHAHRLMEQQSSVSPDRVRRNRHRDPAGVSATGRVADSTLSQRMRDAREARQQAGDIQQSAFAAIRMNLDAHRLLAELSHTHGVQPEKYRVTKGRDGGDRIRCGSRRLNVSDFLTKELNLAWREAGPMLRQVYGRQIVGVPVPQPRALPCAALWRDFAADRASRNEARRAAWRAQHCRERKRRELIQQIFERALESARNRALHPAGRRGALSIARMTRAAGLMALRKSIQQERDALRVQYGDVASPTFAAYLRTRAQKGDDAALAELRRIQPDVHQAGSLPFCDGANEIRPVMGSAQRNEILYRQPALTWVVHDNGNVTYRFAGRDVVRDQGRSIRVLDVSPEAIEAALRLAQAKYGNTLALAGSPDYQVAAARVAADACLPVEFTDERLNRTMTERRMENLRKRVAQSAAHACSVRATDMTRGLRTIPERPDAGHDVSGRDGPAH